MALIGIALAVQQGCEEIPATPEEEQITWDSPKMREVERQWQSLEDTYSEASEKIPGDPGKNKYEELQTLIDHLLRKQLSDRELRQLAGSVKAKPNQVFVDRVVEFMVRVFADSGDRESLVTLLSAQCPGRVGFDITIELYLTHWGRGLKDPILILSEAYAKSQVAATRHDLANAIRRSFAGQGIRGKDDAEYIENAMQWYEKEKDNLVVNPNYRRNEIFFPLESYERNPKLYEDPPPSPFKRELLFVSKTPSQGSPKPEPEAGQTASTVRNNNERAFSTDGKASGNGLAQLEGTWEATEATDDGEPVPQEKLKGMRIVFDKGTFAWISPNGENGDQLRVRLVNQQGTTAIDLLQMPRGALTREQTTPLVYDLQEETTAAIYELKGDTLRMCLPWPGASQRPTSFKAEKGSRETSFTFQRVRE
jgi:uncharacterized protein (TIGR03067 family)